MANEPVPTTRGPSSIAAASSASPSPDIIPISTTPQQVISPPQPQTPSTLPPQMQQPKSQASASPITNPLPTFFEENKNAEQKAPEDKQTTTPGAEDLEEVVNPNAENFKKLRTVHKETKEALKKIETEKEEIASKLKAYETGEAVPEVLRQKEEEITRLSRYEKLVNLKGSKEYQEKYVTPIKEAQTKLKEIFADYGVPQDTLDSVVNRALNTGNRAELNRFLLEHLGNDELGASDAKALILKAREVQTRATEAENEPQAAMQTLQQENEAVNQVREQNRRTHIKTVATNTWLSTLDEIRSEGQLTELIHREDDPEFNSKFPDRILPQAAKEYGKFITTLAEQGITDLPKELANAIARAVLLSHASGVAIATRNAALEHLDSITTNMSRQHHNLRPPVGSGVPRGPDRDAVQRVLTPEQEAAAITNKVLAGR